MATSRRRRDIRRSSRCCYRWRAKPSRNLRRELSVYPNDHPASTGWSTLRLANLMQAEMSSASRSGISARIASRERPASRRSSTSVTRMRMPRTQGRPPHCCGFVVMRFKVSTGPIWHVRSSPAGSGRDRLDDAASHQGDACLGTEHRRRRAAAVALHRFALCRHHTIAIGRRSGWLPSALARRARRRRAALRPWPLVAHGGLRQDPSHAAPGRHPRRRPHHRCI